MNIFFPNLTHLNVGLGCQSTVCTPLPPPPTPATPNFESSRHVLSLVTACYERLCSYPSPLLASPFLLRIFLLPDMGVIQPSPPPPATLNFEGPRNVLVLVTACYECLLSKSHPSFAHPSSILMSDFDVSQPSVTPTPTTPPPSLTLRVPVRCCLWSQHAMNVFFPTPHPSLLHLSFFLFS